MKMLQSFQRKKDTRIKAVRQTVKACEEVEIKNYGQGIRNQEYTKAKLDWQ